MVTFQAVGTPRDTARYRIMQELKKAIAHVRDAEDIARLELGDQIFADRIRELHEHYSEDVVNGKRTHSTWARLPI